MAERHSVLFVCLGNICRSAAAEGVFRKIAADAGRGDEFDVDSAGTGSWHVGSRADERMHAAAERRGYVLESIARQIRREDFDRFDLIITMDEDNFRNVTRLAADGDRARIARMRDFCQRLGGGEVPDPYFGGEEGFEDVLDILEDACSGLLKSI